MHNLQQSKCVPLRITTAGATNATQDSDILDTAGYGWCTIDIALNKATASGTNQMVSLQLEHATDNSTSNVTAVTGFRGGTDFTIAGHSDTSNFGVIRFEVDLSDKERYLIVSYTTDDANYDDTAIFAYLQRGEPVGGNASKMGYTQVVVG